MIFDESSCINLHIFVPSRACILHCREGRCLATSGRQQYQCPAFTKSQNRVHKIQHTARIFRTLFRENIRMYNLCLFDRHFLTRGPVTRDMLPACRQTRLWGSIFGYSKVCYSTPHGTFSAHFILPFLIKSNLKLKIYFLLLLKQFLFSALNYWHSSKRKKEIEFFVHLDFGIASKVRTSADCVEWVVRAVCDRRIHTLGHWIPCQSCRRAGPKNTTGTCHMTKSDSTLFLQRFAVQPSLNIALFPVEIFFQCQNRNKRYSRYAAYQQPVQYSTLNRTSPPEKIQQQRQEIWTISPQK